MKIIFNYFQLAQMTSQNPDKEYPSNNGLPWLENEETTLLEELHKNMDIEIIAQNHNRTIGGIQSRRRKIAYKMFLKNMSMEEIIDKTKLDEESIKKTINRRKKPASILSVMTRLVEMENEIKKIKDEIKEIKETISETQKIGL